MFTSEAMKIVLDELPEFKSSEHWKYCLELHEEMDMSMCAIMTALGRYVKDLLVMKDFDSDQLIKIFNLVEQLMVDGDDNVKDGVATCFLENLINYSAWGRIDPFDFIYLLGKNSLKYCKAWDKFTGSQTPGLWKSKWEWWNYKID